VFVAVADGVYVSVLVGEGSADGVTVGSVDLGKVLDQTGEVVPTLYKLTVKESPSTVMRANPCESPISM